MSKVGGWQWGEAAAPALYTLETMSFVFDRKLVCCVYFGDDVSIQGYGTLLMEEAVRIAQREHRSTKLAVISGVGTRHYYRKLGFQLNNIPDGSVLFSVEGNYTFSSSNIYLVGFFRLKSNLRFKNHTYMKELQLFSTDTNSHQTEQRLAGKIALITGAASGIGKATATEFIKNGAKVVLADINTQLGKSTADKLGPNASFVACDVTRESQFALAVDAAVDKYGRLDILHNNAGVAGCLAQSIAALDMSDFDLTMAINVRSMFCYQCIKTELHINIPDGSVLLSVLFYL